MTDSEITVIKSKIKELEALRDKIKDDHAIVCAQITALVDIWETLTAKEKDRTSAVGM
jgi:hypothetical protein